MNVIKKLFHRHRWEYKRDRTIRFTGYGKPDYKTTFEVYRCKICPKIGIRIKKMRYKSIVTIEIISDTTITCPYVGGNAQALQNVVSNSVGYPHDPYNTSWLVTKVITEIIEEKKEEEK